MGIILTNNLQKNEAALKIQKWWRNNINKNYYYNDYIKINKISEESDFSDTSSESNIIREKESDIPKRSFCKSVIHAFIEISIVILLPMVYFRVKNMYF